jgi:hypothetical protein
VSWDSDYALHFLGGAVICAILVVAGPWWWLPFAMVLLLAIWGYVREKDQHGWEKLTLHQWTEAVLWPIGGLCASVAGLAF